MSVALALTMAGLGGCVSLLPKTPPVQLYQIGRLAPPPASAASSDKASPGIAVALSSVTLPRAATGDQILTLTGQEAAYIAGARWITPAVLMVQEDAQRAFEAQSGRVRLLGRGDVGTASARLALEFGDFEARYDNGPAAAPVIVVSVRATLTRLDGGSLGEHTFSIHQPAAENRVTAIVDAFDRATSQALGEVTSWTGATTAAAVPASSAAPFATTTTSTSSTQVRR